MKEDSAIILTHSVFPFWLVHSLSHSLLQSPWILETSCDTNLKYLQAAATFLSRTRVLHGPSGNNHLLEQFDFLLIFIPSLNNPEALVSFSKIALVLVFPVWSHCIRQNLSPVWFGCVWAWSVGSPRVRSSHSQSRTQITKALLCHWVKRPVS
jgi:hypothetical protein